MFRIFFTALCCLACAGASLAQEPQAEVRGEYGPVVTAYLGYLDAEQEVVDDRASRHEISPAYYRRNSNRIRALRRMAVQLARASRNDYLPELYAVTRDELGTIFDPAPRVQDFHVGGVINNTFRYLGAVRAGEPFYLFARLDIYEQAELMRQGEGKVEAHRTRQQRAGSAGASSAQATSEGEAPTRPRRVSPP